MREKGFKKGVITGVVAALAIVVAAVLVMFLFFPGIRLKIAGLWASGTALSEDVDTVGLLEKLNELSAYINLNAIYGGSSQDAEDGIAAGYISSLGDDYSAYYTQQQYDSQMQGLSGEYAGIGCTVATDQTTGAIYVYEVQEDSPAQEAGILVGDVIVSVDGNTVEGMTVNDVVSLVRGKEGESVEIGITRDGAGITVTAVRRQLEENTVTYEMLEGNIGYIVLSKFEDVSVSQMRTALESLIASGMKGLVIDLRNNPGGSLKGVLGVSELFLESGENIFYTVNKQGQKTEYNAQGTPLWQGDTAVLVNGNSASASEVLTGTLKDHGIAEIVGERTFGKGIMQEYYQLSDGSGMKLTTAKYYTPNGSDIHGVGIGPDINAADDENTPNVDEALEAAISSLGTIQDAA